MKRIIIALFFLSFTGCLRLHEDKEVHDADDPIKKIKIGGRVHYIYESNDGHQYLSNYGDMKYYYDGRIMIHYPGCYCNNKNK